MQPRMIRPNAAGRTNTALSKQCPICQLGRPINDFMEVKGWHFADGRYTICNSCVKERMEELDWSWNELSKLFQGIDIPFVPQEFDRLKQLNGSNVIPIYVKMFGQLEYESLDWKMYDEKYTELRKKGKLDLEIPLVRDTYFDDLKLRWGPEYDDEVLLYLENLYTGLLPAIGNDLQRDQAQKLCKISWNIEERIRAGDDFDKLMGSYEKMAKIANINTATIAGDSDFSSVGEVVAWLEKRGWLNPYFSDAKQDIIDELTKSTQTFAQRLYVNESGLGEEIEERILQLKLAATLDQQDAALDAINAEEEDLFFQLEEHDDLEEYEQDGYDELIIDDVLNDDTQYV